MYVKLYNIDNPPPIMHLFTDLLKDLIHGNMVIL